MESSSASEGASPDVRPVICESLQDLTDWGDLLVDQSSQESSTEDHSRARSSPTGDIPGNGASNLPHKTPQSDSSVIPSVVHTNGTAVRTRKRIRHSWPDVSVKLGQDVTYNCFPHEHFSFAFKEVIFREEKIQEEDDEDELPEISFVPSPEPTLPPKKEKSSHKRHKVLHSRKTDKKASVLTEQRGKNTPVAQQGHCEDKKDKLKEGRSSPLIALAVSLKKPGVTKERRLLPSVVTSGGTTAGSQGTTLHAQVATLQPGVQTSANKGVHPQQSAGASNVLQILNTPQDGRRTPTHSRLVTVLPPTPPNEPVVVQPVSQTVSRVVPKGLPGQLPMQRVQVFVKQVAAQPSKPLGVSPFSSPTFRIMKTSQILTPPIDKRVAPVSSPAKQPEQPCRKTEQPLQKTEQPPEKPEHPSQKSGEPLQKPEEPHGCRPSEISSETPVTKDLSSTLTSLEDSSEATTKPSLAVATDDGARAEGDEEEIDVGETLITTSQDETDSQVEVVESEVEIREDTKEVLSSLKRKAPSSPCSTLLKIKCEKIDAVVRINKTNEDLYRAEGSQEKRSVQARRNSFSAAEQGCFFNVVDKSSRLGVCPCGRANAYDAMIACDNPQCEIEWYHFTCVGVTKVPKDEWFCPFCSKEAAETLRKKKERRKEQRRKKKELELKRKRMKKPQQEEAGLCPCGQPNSWDRMIACDGRDCSVEWYHFRCVDVKSPPETEWLCILCRDSVQDPSNIPYVRRKRQHRPIKYSIYGEGGDGSTDESKEAMDWKEDESSDDSGDSDDTSNDEEGVEHDHDHGDDGRSRVRERARTKWREALSEEVDIEVDSNSSDDEDDDDELSRSRRSRRSRHKKIDLDFEDGAEFDDDVDGRRGETVRTKATPKRVRTSSGEKRRHSSGAQTKESPRREKDMVKVSTNSGDQGSEAVNKQKNVSEGRFLIRVCSACGQEFIDPLTEGSQSANQENPAAAVLCRLCVNKSKKGGEKCLQAGILLPPSKTKDTIAATATPSPATVGQDDPPNSPPGEAGAGRSTRFHEIVACKVCGMGYRTRVSLLIHMKAKHLGHLSSFECTPCDRLFISQEECEQHMASLHHV
ncbi:uncharacterized protein LOC100892388 isoform X2 [Strongylocentrotus purpuratus]|uniref:Uncharacterized protein n=1 Tax=Strongylocentrotus purpuratus TaxID=7668 RepID=A0A7M7GEH1_STRPU|nr:uncharacterized protein LOC100892388 isoform X2 [Strongylocentrotus purpuratus]